MKNRDFEIVKGFIFVPNGNGRCVPLDLVNEPKNIASFIFNCPNDTKVLITNELGKLLCNTYGNFLDKCFDLDYREFFINELVELQTFQKEPCEIKTSLYPGLNTPRKAFKEFVYKTTGYKL